MVLYLIVWCVQVWTNDVEPGDLKNQSAAESVGPRSTMDDLLRALADGTRRRILVLVAARERTAGEVALEFALTRPAISQHLGVLLESGLVAMRRVSTRRLYRAERPALARLRAELDAFWKDSLTHVAEI